MALIVGPLTTHADSVSDRAASHEQESPAKAPLSSAVDSAQQETTERATPEVRIVTSVKVEGNRIVSTKTILGKIRTRAGEPLKRDMISEDIKRLYGTGFFRDIQIDLEEEREGFLVIVIVDEKPIVHALVIEGSTSFSAADLRKEAGIVEGQVFSEFELKEAEDAIRNKYYAKGYKFVNVRTEVNVDEEKKEASVYVFIEEGAVYKIRSITLTGVTSFKERKVMKRFRTKKAGFLRRGIFDEAKLKSDLEQVELFYQDEGFLDVAVRSEFTYDHENQRIDINVIVEEGSRYETGKIEITGNVLFPESDIWQALDMLPGLRYSPRGLAEDTAAIRKYYYERGYMNANIEPDIELNSATGKVDIVYRITEGDLFFIDQIKIRGNTKTKDLVIRRELLVFPGERFDGKKLDQSKVRLEDLGYFEEVTIHTEAGSAPNRRSIVVHVTEKRTGELSFGAGVSSIESFIAFAEISQRNFDMKNFPTMTGGGQFMAVRGRIGSERQDIDIRFGEPYLFNKPYSLNLNVFSRTLDADNLDYDEQRIGFSIDVGKQFTETIRSGVGYTLEHVKLEDIAGDAPPELTDAGTENLLSRVRWFISRDTRDSIRKPTSGSVSSLSAELVGSFLGGDQDLVKTQVSLIKYFLFGRHHFEWSNRVGVISPFGDSSLVPVFERFYAGGLGSVRGFDARRVGPIKSGDAVGGSTLLLTSVEYSYPILENFHGALFVDAGHVHPASFDAEFSEVSVSIGPGVKIKTPIGPIALYYGYPIFNEDEDDDNGKFEFSLSRGF